MATIRKRGDKYQVQVRRSGVGSISRSFHTRKDAVAWANHMEVKADRRDLPADPKALQGITLGELVIRYRDTVSIKKRGYVFERSVLNGFLLHPICRRKLSDLSPTHFAAYRDERLKEVKPATVKRQLGPIHHLFEIARDEWGLSIRNNPVGKIKFKGADQRRERRLRESELEFLLSAAKSCRNPLVEKVIRFAVETGMRRGEILSSTLDSVDVKNRCLLIRDTKNGQPRTIPLSTEAIALMHSRMDETVQGRLFPITANAFRLAWERLKRRAGLDDLHFHDLRHEAISRFFEMGLSTPEVALISGHRDIRMLFRYSHASRERILEKLK